MHDDHFRNIQIAIDETVKRALEEDVNGHDLTADLVPEESSCSGSIVSKSSGILCGVDWVETTFKKLDSRITINWFHQDGDLVQSGDTVCNLGGPSRGILTGERTALNFLQTLSAIATKTRRYVDAVQHTRAQILDTRKTIPGLRLPFKYAVKIGGGTNHRMGLYDGILIKENHIAAAGGISQALTAAKMVDQDVPIQVEVENLPQLKEAIEAGCKLILLDNMDTEQLTQAVNVTNNRAQLEASGGITMESVVAVAETGVDRISIGSLTKDIDAMDLSLRLKM